MTKKINFLIVLMLFLILTFLGPARNAFAAIFEPAQLLVDAQAQFQLLNCAEFHYIQTNGHPYPYCPGSVCWNSSSVTNTTVDLAANLGETPYLNASSYGSYKGDVRYRTSYHYNTLYLYAIRCEEPEPAACRKKWVMRIKYDCFGSGNTCPGTEYKFFKVSDYDTTGTATPPMQMMCE